ncbi:MAG: response regulator [Spirochaetaceae bacterium]|nr:MAG: response regulator [Spirochaetaceae bacterium]
MVVFDGSGRVVHSNRAIERMLGQPGSRTHGESFFDFIYPADRADLQREFRSFSRDDTREIRTAVRYVVDGNVRWWQLDITHVFSEHHSPFIFGVVADITDQKRDEERLKAAKDIAEKATRTKSAFLANMSHEIRTPLHTITGMTELLLETSLDEEQKEYAQQVRFSADVLLGLINDILDFSKIEAGKLTLEFIEFDLFTMTEDAVDMVSLEAHKKGLEVIVDIDPDLPERIMADPIRIRQIIVNLFNNAVKFTASGEIRINVFPVESDDAETVTIRFEVVDTGIGIPEDKQSLLFDAFSQVDSSTTRKFGGTGLGLSICRSLVSMMDGKIGVESVEGRGSTFWFEVAFEAPHRERPLAGTQSDVFADRRVLLVDDNPGARAVLKTYLARLVGHVDAVGAGADALTVIRAAADAGTPYDAAVIDLYMPGMDGWQIASEINADKAINATRLILMSPTGRAGGETKMKLLHWFDAYVSKPVKWKELFDAVGASLTGDIDLELTDDEAPIDLEPILDDESDRVVSTIVVAEDHFVNQKLFETILEKMGYNVVVASNGIEAVKAVIENEPALVFMDVQMPEMNGYEAAQRLREDGVSVPIIAVTANAVKGEREKCIDAGMNDYLTKPFKGADLVPFLEKYVLASRTAAGGSDPASDSSPVADIHAMNADDAAPIFNYAGALEAFLGREDVVLRVIESFASKVEEQIQSIETNLSAGDLTAVRADAHGIKGGAWNLEAIRLGNVAAEIEEAAERGDRERCLACRPRLETAFIDFRNYCSTNGMLPAASGPAAKA